MRDRFYMMLSLDHVGMWLVCDSHAIYADSKAMSCDDACRTLEWLTEAETDGRLRTLSKEYQMAG